MVHTKYIRSGGAAWRVRNGPAYRRAGPRAGGPRENPRGRARGSLTSRDHLTTRPRRPPDEIRPSTSMGAIRSRVRRCVRRRSARPLRGHRRSTPLNGVTRPPRWTAVPLEYVRMTTSLRSESERTLSSALLQPTAGSHELPSRHPPRCFHSCHAIARHLLDRHLL